MKEKLFSQLCCFRVDIIEKSIGFNPGHGMFIALCQIIIVRQIAGVYLIIQCTSNKDGYLISMLKCIIYDTIFAYL